MVFDRCIACNTRAEKCLLPDSHRAQSRVVWCCDFLLGGTHGKRIRKQFKPGVTKKEVEKYEHMTIADFERGLFMPLDKGKALVKEVIEKYDIEHIQANSRHPNGSVKYYLKVIKELLGHIALGVLNLTHLEEARTKFKESTGCENISVNRCISVLKTVLNRAVEWGYIQKSPAKYLRPLKVKETIPRFLTHEELYRLRSQIKDKRLDDYVTMMLHTAIRPIDIKSLTWAQVDSENRIIYVTTHKGRRPRTYTVPMDEKIMQIIQRRYKETGGLGKVFDTSNIRKLADKAIKDSGINEGKDKAHRFTIYGLKHTYISNLIMAGVDVATVSELVGVSIQMIKKHYGHLTQEHLRKAQAKVNLTPEISRLEVI